MIYRRNINNYYNPNTKRENNLFKYYQNPLYKKANSIKTMPLFPFVSSLEFTNVCNLDCLFCARAIMTRKHGYMDEALFYKIIEEYRKNEIFVKINGYGENLLHPKAVEFIKEIKKENKLYLTSNCTTLNDKISDALISSNVDILQVSIQGVDKKSYEAQRRKSNFDQVVNNLKGLIKLRSDNPYPFIHFSTTVLDETDEQLNDFIKLGFELGVDSVGIGRTDYDRVIDEMITDNERKVQINEFRKRQTLEKVSDHSYLYKYIDVNWDGIVVSSFFDFDEFIPVGDLNNQTMAEIWNNSEVLNALRVLEKNKLLNKMKVFDTFYHAWHLGEKSYNLDNKEK
jgi:MoaA/NifB/PqqE/SkfB family radical SAM enzyme